MMFETRDEWFDALKAIAKMHGNSGAVRDFDAWTEDWEDKTPNQVYYDEFPEHIGDSDSKTLVN